MQAQDIKDRFRSHVVDRDAAEAMSAVRRGAEGLAAELNMLLGDGREKSLALTKLEEFVFWANAGIARDGDDQLIPADHVG